MDFTLSAVERGLVEAMEALLKAHGPLPAVREWERASVSVGADLWGKLAEQDFLEVGRPGGFCPQVTAMALVEEVSGKFLLPPVLSVTNGVAAFVLAAAGKSARSAAIAWPPLSSSNPFRGRIGGILLADVADVLVIPERRDEGAAVYWFPLPDARLKPVAMQSGWPGWRGELPLEAAQRKELSGAVLDWARVRLLIGVAAWSIGAGLEAIRLAVDYAGQRVQFGHPIGSYQSVQNRLVDAKIQLDEARRLVMRAAAQIDAAAIDPIDAPPVPSNQWESAGLARRWAGSALARATLAATQTFGGYGFIEESDIQLYFRRGKEMQVRIEPNPMAKMPLVPFGAVL